MELCFNTNIKNMLAGVGTLILRPLFLTNSLILSLLLFDISKLGIRVEILR